MFEKVVKYNLHWTEINNFEARLTQRLVRRYIQKVRIPALREEGWDELIYISNAWCGFDELENKNRPKAFQIFWHLEENFFLSKGLCPTKQFLKYFKKLTKVLEHTPDGFLFKLKKTKQTKPLKEALKEFGMQKINWGVTEDKFSEHEGYEQLSVVEGEIEIVEVKTGKAIITSGQMTTYRKALEEKYPLRFLHVNIISIEENEFEIEEKLVTTTEELETVQLEERKRSHVKK